MPAGFENRSVRYFSTSIPLACAVEIIEYKSALHFAPRSVLLKSQFLRPTVKGLIALLQHTNDQQFQCRRFPTCGTKNFKAALSSCCLISAYPRFWVFSDCTFLDNSIIIYSFIALFLVHTEFGIDSKSVFILFSHMYPLYT